MPKPEQLKADDETPTHASWPKAFESRLTLKVRIRCTSAARTHDLELEVGGARTTIHLSGGVKQLKSLHETTRARRQQKRLNRGWHTRCASDAPTLHAWTSSISRSGTPEQISSESICFGVAKHLTQLNCSERFFVALRPAWQSNKSSSPATTTP